VRAQIGAMPPGDDDVRALTPALGH
jgi:hypothetical protein